MSLNSIPVPEGETLAEFVDKANNPDYVNKVKKQLKWLPEPNQLVLHTILGKYIFINYDENDTLNSLKEKIQDREGIPPSQQRLFYKGEEVQDPLSKYDFKLGQIETPVYLKLSLR